MAENYVCTRCRKKFELEDKARCPLCGYRIIAKARPPFRKRITAR